MKKRLSVLVLALAMVLTMSVSVFATGANSGDNGGATSYDATEAKLVKYVTAAEGVTLPDETFTFTFTPVDVTGDAAKDWTVPASDHPTGKTATIATSALTEKTEGKGQWIGSVAIKDIFKQGLTTANPAGDFPRAGEYTFAVAETKPATVPEGWTYSSDTYTLRLIVDKDGNIDDVTVQKGTEGEKVDPTDPDPTDNPGGATPAASNGGFTFTNNYVKMVTTHEEPDPDNPGQTKTVDGALKVEKLVTGEYGNYKDPFAFTVDVTVPSNTAITFPDYSLAGNTPASTSIKSGDSFVYASLPAGSKITITETAANQGGYTTTFAGTKNTVTNGDEFILSQDGQFVKVTNAFDDTSVTPTGIIINNLPYVLLIGIALGGIVLFSRKRRYE